MSSPLNALFQGLSTYADRPAFFIAGQAHTYQDLLGHVNAIRAYLQAGHAGSDRIMGLYAQDHILTYASILALWAEGRAYVPLASTSPVERNQDIMAQAGISTVLSTEALDLGEGTRILRTDGIPPCDTELPFEAVSDGRLAYILFTSGTTGKPKGVPIEHGAIGAFLEAFERLGFNLVAEDRCLQMFDLTFDPSVMSFLTPLQKGACVYTIPNNALKYTYIHELLEDQQLTVAPMVPSILALLRPYFHEIHCPMLRLNTYCGEGLPLDVLTEWSRCAPNAVLVNIYGPTEHTIVCTAYTYSHTGRNKERNGILSIGKPMYGTQVSIMNGSGGMAAPGEPGELCLAGPQATKGYWNNPERTAQQFFMHEGIRYYRTGDLCEQDTDGDILYLGRMDQQVKVQGFRVELGDLEHHARQHLDRQNAVAVAIVNRHGMTELALIVEGEPGSTAALVEQLRAKLPEYMLPRHILHLEELPLNSNGKVDRPALRALAQERST